MPSIAVGSNDNIHVVRDDGISGNREIFYQKSTNGGVTWITKRLTWTSGHSSVPDITIDSNNHIHVVWQDDTPGKDEIYYKKSTNGGTSWTTKRLTHNAGGSRTPAVAADSNNHVHVVWYDDSSGNWEIYYKKSTDGGASWATKRLTWNFVVSWLPDITVDSSDNIHVVLQSDLPGSYDIYYKRSTDSGSTWASKRLTWIPGNSWFPAIALGPNNHIHVVWREDSRGNPEIYYKKGIQ